MVAFRDDPAPRPPRRVARGAEAKPSRRPRGAAPMRKNDRRAVDRLSRLTQLFRSRRSGEPQAPRRADDRAPGAARRHRHRRGAAPPGAVPNCARPGRPAARSRAIPNLGKRLTGPPSPILRVACRTHANDHARGTAPQELGAAALDRHWRRGGFPRRTSRVPKPTAWCGGKNFSRRSSSAICHN